MTTTPTPTQTFYLVLPAQPPDVGASIRPISRLLQEEEPTVRTWLNTPTFRVLRRFAKKSNADGLLQQLKALGIRTFVVSDSQMRGHLFLWCMTANRGQGGMAFRDFSDQPIFVPFPDIAQVTILNVTHDDGAVATWIDLNRRSTPITPRLDASMFDFGKLLNRVDARIEDFLVDLGTVTDTAVDRGFQKHRADAAQLSKDFASTPSEFAPDRSKLHAPYRRDEARLANIYSFLSRANRID